MSHELIALKKKAWQILDEAQKHGIITAVEAQRRMELITSAQDPAELDTVLGDLISLPREDRTSQGGEFKCLTFLGERRIAAIELSDNPALIAVMGAITLDFTQDSGPRLQNIHVKVFMGEVKILVPPGTKVINNVTAILGSVGFEKQKARDYGSSLTVVISGSVTMGELKIVYQ